MKSAQQEIEERTKLAGNNQFELLLFRLGESKGTGHRELFGINVFKVREVLALLLAGKRVQLARIMRQAEVVPDQLDAMDALRALQQADVAMALVHDEYGHLEGIVTPADLLAAIVGNFASHQDHGEAPLLAEQSDGSLLVAGALPADALADRLGLDLPDMRDYATAAGFALSVLKRLPQAGEEFSTQGWRFEVAEMDGRRIEQLRVLPEPPEAA